MKIHAYVGSVSLLPLANWRRKTVDSMTNLAEVAFEFDDSSWQNSFGGRRSSFELPQNSGGATVSLPLRSLGEQRSVYFNGQAVAENVSHETETKEIAVAADKQRPGKNVIAIVATPPGDWQRGLFSGLAQIIVQATGSPGDSTLTAKSPDMADGVLKIQAEPTMRHPFVP